ncbi:AfsR/SARP family transcriptional regulator [Streptomyces roseoverticillatus]|uniref:AfsR/SARP family transcriptional regulator n=1 Tax=Streptomyces roseoverticillatus TaxID=66429 RepID=UPI0033D94A3F
MEIRHGGEVCTPTAPKTRQTLALLLFRANQAVDTSAVIDELWCDNPPRSSMTTMQTYIYQLRKLFSRVTGEDTQQKILVSQPPGYCLRISEDQLDAKVFERLATEGRELLATGHVEQASRKLHEALKLWRGRTLADVSAGRLLEGHIVHLEELRITTLELRCHADLQLGAHRELVPELRSLVTEYPLNEWFHGQLITALHHAGRRGEALQAYQNLRRVLDTELGIEPSIALQSLQRDLLAEPRLPASSRAGRPLSLRGPAAGSNGRASAA